MSLDSAAGAAEGRELIAPQARQRVARGGAQAKRSA